ARAGMVRQPVGALVDPERVAAQPRAAHRRHPVLAVLGSRLLLPRRRRRRGARAAGARLTLAPIQAGPARRIPVGRRRRLSRLGVPRPGAREPRPVLADGRPGAGGHDVLAPAPPPPAGRVVPEPAPGRAYVVVDHARGWHRIRILRRMMRELTMLLISLVGSQGADWAIDPAHTSAMF